MAGEELQKTPGPLEDIAQQCRNLSADIESGFENWDLNKFDDFLKKCGENPKTLILLPLVFFLQLGKASRKELPVGEEITITPNKETFTQKDFERLKAVKPNKKGFSANDDNLVSEMRENRSDLYGMISYAENTTGVPFSVLSATFKHESLFTTDITGDKGAAIGIGQMHGPAYKTATSTEYYRRAMHLKPGEKPPKRGAVPLSDILATACLYRWIAERIGINLSGQMCKRDFVALRAYYHHPAKYAERMKNYTAIFIAGTMPLDDIESEKERRILKKYDDFANKILNYNNQITASYV